METPSAIELQGTLNLTDVVRFQYFHTLRRTWLFLPVAVFLFFVLATLAIISPDPFSQKLPFAGLLLLWLFLLGAMPYRNARKIYSSQQYFREPIFFSFTPEKISNRGAAVSGTLEWSVLKHVRETGNYFLLYQQPNIAYIVPKRFFHGPEELEAWRRLVAASVDPKLIERPGFVGRRC